MAFDAGFCSAVEIGMNDIHMDTHIIRLDRSRPLDEQIEPAARSIRAGGLVAFPTETVYGLGGDALNPESAARIYAAKGRPSDNPLIVHIAAVEDIRKLSSEDSRQLRLAYTLASHFWPGPLTMILDKSATVPDRTTGGLNTVAVRLPSDEAARALIRQSGTFIAAPSANLSGRPSCTTAAHVIQDMDGRVDYIIDGGASVLGLESTIVDLTAEPVTILRPGFITEEMLEDVLGSEVSTNAALLPGDRPRAPGMKYRHYAPRGELTVVRGDREAVRAHIGELAAESDSQGYRTMVIDSGSGDINEYARNLYENLRYADDLNIERIYAAAAPAEGVGVAVMNRLVKAAGGRVIDI